MSPGRSFFLNRINAQLAILILASLLVIHAVITASIFFSNRWNNAAAFDGDPAEFVSLVRLVAGTPADWRAPLLKQIAHSFPDLKLQAATVMPPPRNGAGVDRRLDFLNQRLSPVFHVVAAPSVARSGRDAAMFDVAVRLPDGTALKASLRPREGLPFLIGPITLTVLFIVISVTLLGLWAARALHRPLSRFAKAADGFDLDGEITELPERGPEEIRAVAKAFNQMRERIKKLVDDRTRMLAAMGHDLRTPITRLRLRSEFIAEKELRAQMLRDLDQMRAMTDGVLSFLRDEQTREAATSMDLATTLQTVCDQFADLGHAVTYEGPAHVRISGRPDDLQRAVANLVDNATRYGTHTVVRLTRSADCVCIAVEDDGPGIPDVRKDAMLEAFVRGEAARTMDDRSGFGLGLSIARIIAEAHGGALALRDRTQHGLIACITLPAAGLQMQTAVAAKVA